MKKIIAASILFTLFIGCVSKQVETLTTNYDNAGNVLNERSENVKIKGFLGDQQNCWACWQDGVYQPVVNKRERSHADQYDCNPVYTWDRKHLV